MAFRIPRCPEQVGAGCLGRLGLHRQVQVGSKVQVCKSVVVLLKSVERDFYLQETCTRTPGDFQVSPSSEGEHLKNSSHQDRNLVRLWRRVRVITFGTSQNSATCSTPAKCCQQSGVGKCRVEAAPGITVISPEEFVGSVCVSPALNLLPEGLVTKWGHSLGSPQRRSRNLLEHREF